VAVRDGVVAIGNGTAVSLFDANTGKRRFDVPGHGDGVGGVGFLPDGSAVTSGADGWIAIWDPASGRRVRTIDTGALEFGSLAISSDGRRALTGGWRVPASLWDLETGELLRRFEGRSARGVAFGPGTVATGLLDGRILVWDAETGAKVGELPGNATGVFAVRPDGKRALIPTALKSSGIAGFPKGELLGALDAPGRDVTSMAYSPDGALAATGGADGMILIWNGEGGEEKEKARLETRAPVRALAFGPRGLLVAGHSNGGVTIWDAPAGRRLASYQGHSGGVTSVAIDPEGKRAISGSGDTTAIVWRIP
jgi:WD40 repeat protein